MMQELQDRVAFITGGASGIGLGMAHAFARAGMKVAIGDLRTDRLAAAEATIRELTDQVLCLETDVVQRESLEAAADATEAAFGKVHVLCNNAGVGGGGLILETPDDRWRRTMGVNLWGVLHGIQVFLPRMLAHGEAGHVVNTSSFSGIVGHHHQSVYGTSKFAVVGLSEYLRNDLEATNLSASVLCPHVVDTAIFYPDLADDDREAIAARRAKMPWLEQLAVAPDAVGEMVVKAILANELYIFTDGDDSRTMLEEHSRLLLDAMNRQFPPSQEPR